MTSYYCVLSSLSLINFLALKFALFEIDSCLLLIYVSIVYFSPYLLLIYTCLYVKSGFLIDDVLLGLVGTPWWLGHPDFLTLKVFHAKPKAIHQVFLPRHCFLWRFVLMILYSLKPYFPVFPEWQLLDFLQAESDTGNMLYYFYAIQSQ